jgi:hypothetical protein
MGFGRGTAPRRAGVRRLIGPVGRGVRARPGRTRSPSRRCDGAGDPRSAGSDSGCLAHRHTHQVPCLAHTTPGRWYAATPTRTHSRSHSVELHGSTSECATAVTNRKSPPPHHQYPTPLVDTSVIMHATNTTARPLCSIDGHTAPKCNPTPSPPTPTPPHTHPFSFFTPPGEHRSTWLHTPPTTPTQHPPPISPRPHTSWTTHPAAGSAPAPFPTLRTRKFDTA